MKYEESQLGTFVKLFNDQRKYAFLLDQINSAAEKSITVVKPFNIKTDEPDAAIHEIK